MSRSRKVAHAPGRVNLMGDHTDYNGGLALPMAIDLGTKVVFDANSEDEALVMSSSIGGTAAFSLAGDFVSAPPHPRWAALAGVVIAQSAPERGGDIRVTSSIPVSSGLSSSAAFCVALSLAFGADLDPVRVAQLCQEAEDHVGARVGLMDPLISMAGVSGHGLLIDFSVLNWSTVALPADAEWVVVHSGEYRDLVASPYGGRRAECSRAAAILGKRLGQAVEGDLARIEDPTLHARAGHVVSECARTGLFADALEAGDLVGAGALMDESHLSLARDFECSTPVIDQLVGTLRSRSGVLGARMTGGGFGGCVVALCEPGCFERADWPERSWRLQPSDGARVSG